MTEGLVVVVGATHGIGRRSPATTWMAAERWS